MKPILFALALAGTLHQAQAQDAPEQLETVSMTLKRDSSMLPYARMNTLLNGLQRHGQGLFRMDFRIEAKDPAKPIPRPKLAVQLADRDIPIVFNPDGSFELPLVTEAEAKDADLSSNIAKGSAGLRGTLHLTVKPEELDMATVRRLMSTARKLRSELLPWYARWLFPQIEGVRVCSLQPQWALEWPSPAQAGQILTVSLQVDASDRDPDEVYGKKPEASEPRRQCTTLTGQEAWPDTARLVAPDDSKLSVRLSRSKQAQ
jgi:hypothetical protein